MIDGAAAAYALLLGVVAAFNPCGFALLPAYITVLVTGSADATVPRSVAVRRAVLFGLAMTVGFMAVFTAFGLLFGAVNAALQGSILPYVAYVTVAMGVVLVWLGVVLARGGELKGPGLKLGSGASAPSTSFWSQAGYGASFAVASLSCTIGLFLAVVTQAITASNPVSAVIPFVIYGIGMGTSIVAVSLLAALAGSSAAASLRSKTPMLMRAGGWLMIVAGLYVVVFGLAEVLPQFGVRVLDPVLHTTTQWQGTITGAIQSWGTPVLVGLVVTVTAAVLWAVIAGRRAQSSVGGNVAQSPTPAEPITSVSVEAVSVTAVPVVAESPAGPRVPASAAPPSAATAAIRVAPDSILHAIRDATKK